MKKIITFLVLAILASVLLTGCEQNKEITFKESDESSSCLIKDRYGENKPVPIKNGGAIEIDDNTVVIDLG